MGFEAERVRRVTCPRCEREVDVSLAKPLSTIVCPVCRAGVPVPVRFGSILVTHKLGKGSGARVYAAFDRVLGRNVAIKLLRAADKQSKGIQDGLTEARRLMEVRHPHVVEIYAIQSWQHQPVIIMELLEGGALRDLIARNGCVPESRAIRIALEAAFGLRETHRRGMLHLDVKPGNLMFTAAGATKVLDFGLGVIAEQDRAEEIVGSPLYVAPELVRRRPPTAQADIYSLGVTLYYALCGEPPFRGRSLDETLKLRLRQPPPDVQCVNPCVSEPTARLVLRMMATEPHDRVQSYDDLIDELRRLERGLEHAAVA